jgi:hypothetical protein
VSRLAIILPLKNGASETARALLKLGPPFDLQETQFDRHSVFMSGREIVVVLEGPGESGEFDRSGKDPWIWKERAAWSTILAGGRRVATRTGYKRARSSTDSARRSLTRRSLALI